MLCQEPGSLGKVRHTAVAPTVAPVGRLSAQFIELRDAASFEELVRRYSAFIYSVAYQITTDRHDAEDAAQIAFLQLAIALKSAKKIDKPVGWLETVARNQAMRIIRGKSRLRRREQKASKSETHLDQPVNQADDAALAGVVRDVLDDLPEHYRLPLVLHYFGGMSLETIAAELKSNPNTVGTRLHRGRKMLGHRLQKLGLQFDADALSLLLASLIPATIAKAVLRNVTITSASPPGLAGSILQTIHLSIGAAMRGKLRLATIALVAAAMSAAVASSLKSFSFPQINVMQWIQRIEQSLSPRPMLQVDSTSRPPVRDSLTPTMDLQNRTALSASTVSLPADRPARISPPPQPIVTSAPAAVVDNAPRPILVPLPTDESTPSSISQPIQRAEKSAEALAPVGSDSHVGKSRTEKESPERVQAADEDSLLSVGGGGVEFSGARPSLSIPPFQNGGLKLRGSGDLSITGSFVQNGRVVADGQGLNRELNLSNTPPVQNTIENPPDGSNGWYAVNGGKLLLPPLHVTSADQSYTWGESASDPQLDLVNSVRLQPVGLKRGGDVSIALMTLADNEDQFASLPSGWGVVGLWQIDRGDMQAEAIDVTVRYNQIAAAYLPMNDQSLTFLTYDGQWNATPFDWVQLDRQDHLIEATLAGQFDYFAVAGPLNPDMIPSDLPMFSTLTPEPTISGLPLLALSALRRRRQHLNAAPAPAASEP